MSWNLKEARGKLLDGRSEITYEAGIEGKVAKETETTQRLHRHQIIIVPAQLFQEIMLVR